MGATRRNILGVLFILVGLAPLGIQIVSHLVAVRGEVEFPPWIEGGGVLVALIAANMLEDGVSKSATSLGKAAKGWLPWAQAKARTEERPGSGQ